MIAKERARKDKAQPKRHQPKNSPASMRPKSLDQCNSTQCRDAHRQRSMRLLLTGNQVRKDRRHGDQNRRHDTVHYTKCPAESAEAREELLIIKTLQVKLRSTKHPRSRAIAI